MTAFVETNSISQIEKGYANETAQFLYKTWREYNGHMPPSGVLMQLSPYLVIFDDVFALGDSPDILFYGSETLFSTNYPEAEISTKTNPKRFLQEEYRSLVCEGYQNAVRGEPVFETIGTGKLLGPRKPELIYDRIVLRFKKKLGSYLVSHSIKRSVKWLSDQSDLQGPHDRFRRIQGFHLSSPAPLTSEYRLHEQL